MKSRYRPQLGRERHRWRLLGKGDRMLACEKRNACGSRMRCWHLLLALSGFVACLGPSCSDDGGPIIERAPWVCDGVVTDDAAEPLPDVQVWVSGYQQSTSDSSGAYHAILGMSRDDVEAIRFAKAGYRDTLVSLAGALDVADHRLAMNIALRGESERLPSVE